MLRLLSYNVFCGHLPWTYYNLAYSRNLILQLRDIRKLDPDIVALQEVYDPEVEDRFRLFFDDYHFAGSRSNDRYGWLKLALMAFVVMSPILLPLALWAAAPLQALLLYAVWVLCMARSGVGCFIRGGRPGLLLGWKKSHFHVLSSTFRAFECQHRDWHNRFCARGYQDVTLRNVHTNRSIRVLHTHLDSEAGAGRCAQVQELPLPTADSVLAGDLNASPSSIEIQMLVERGWVDSDRHQLPTWTSIDDFVYRWLYGIQPPLKIDYAFLSPSWKVHDHCVVLPDASDHRGVLVTAQ